MILFLAGCFTLDAFLHNPVPCDTVGPATCEDKDSVWDQVCTPCETPYAWDRSYDWMDGTLADGATIRPIDPTAVQDADVEGSKGAVLDAYFIPAHGEHPENSLVTLIYNHGNYAGIEHYMPRVRMAHEAGFNVFVWDYRGYGKTTPDSAPSAEVWFDDAQRVRDAVDQWAPDPDKVLIYANSLGGIPAVEMALHSPGCALLFEAGFTSLEAITVSNSGVSFPDSMLSSGQYDNIEKISEYTGPFMAMIGDADATFRVQDTEQLVAEAGASDDQKKLWVLPGVQHGLANGGVPEASFADWAAEIDAFLDETGACR